MKLVRRDEVARLYGVSESVFDGLLSHQINNLCLTIQRASVKLFFDDKNQALKILKRPFGNFCGSGQKLHAQQSGIKVGSTKRLNGTQRRD
ncbi:hypothetical protein A8139_16610 [Marinomonas primoryensis]|uniref:Uncharacterized protein n=1 Tax=Marinomonas primoryensis TaxID=178399 RepID=A0A2Z4PV06_9GAMM|nr:hypothetical protein A8139_16610 [Marinomonas primoryensis]